MVETTRTAAARYFSSFIPSCRLNRSIRVFTALFLLLLWLFQYTKQRVNATPPSLCAIFKRRKSQPTILCTLAYGYHISIWKFNHCFVFLLNGITTRKIVCFQTGCEPVFFSVFFFPYARVICTFHAGSRHKFN